MNRLKVFLCNSVIYSMLSLIYFVQPVNAFFNQEFNPDSDKVKQIVSLIESGDLDQLSLKLKRFSSKLNKTEQLHYLFKAVTQKQCQDEIVQMLVDTNRKKVSEVSYKKGALSYPMTTKLILHKATLKNCPNEARSILEITKDSDVIAVLQKKKDSYTDLVSFNEYVQKEGAQKGTLNHIVDMIQVYVDFFVAKQKSGMSPEIKSAAKTFSDVGEKTLEGIEKRSAASKNYNSPSSLKKRALHIIQKIEKQKNYIAHQKRIGEISGVVDKKALYEAADNILFYEKQLNKLKSTYKNKTGTELNLPHY